MKRELLTRSPMATEVMLPRGKGARTMPVRAALTTLEVTVAASLLAVSIAVLMPLGLSAGKLWKETRQVRLASDVLVSQIDELTHVDRSEISQRLDHLQLTSELKEILPEARFTHRVTNEDDVLRIELSLEWDRGHPSVPITLVGWNHRAERGEQP